MNVFVTGAGGFVGRELLQGLRLQKIPYVAVDLQADKDMGIGAADIRSRDIAGLIPEGADAIIHLAGLTRDPDCKDRARECFDANVMATLNLIEACQARKVKQFIFASTEWVYGSFADGEIKDEDSLIDVTKLISEYAFSKLVSEQNLRQKFLHGFCPVTILRFGIIYGSRGKNWSAVEALFNAVKTSDEVQVGSQGTGRCFIHVEDIVAGIIKALGLQGFHVINLEGDRLITLADVVSASSKVLGKSPKVVETSAHNKSVRNVSNKRAKEILGWHPQVDLLSGLERLKGFLLSKGTCR